jgi:hypothetical protein
MSSSQSAAFGHREGNTISIPGTRLVVDSSLLLLSNKIEKSIS